MKSEENAILDPEKIKISVHRKNRGDNKKRDFFGTKKSENGSPNKSDQCSCDDSPSCIEKSYFFMSGRIKKKGVNTEYCTAEKSLEGFSTGTLEGVLFENCGDMIRGNKYVEPPNHNEPGLSQELVGRIDLRTTQLVDATGGANDNWTT